MLLTKEEIRERAAQESIPLTKNLLEQYIKYGFITSAEKRSGYARGVTALFQDSAIEVIKLVTRLKSLPHIEHQKDIIFILFWQGYPVNMDKLKDRLLEVRGEAINTFETLANLSRDPENANDHALDIARRVVTAHRPGKPSKAARERMESERKLYFATIELFNELVTTGTVSQSSLFHMLQMFESPTLIQELEFDIEQQTNWLDYHQWMDALSKATDQDFDASLQAIELLREYWSFLASTEVTRISGLMMRFKDEYGYYPIAENPKAIKWLLAIIIASGMVPMVSRLLALTEVKRMWRLFCRRLDRKLRSKGGEMYG